MKRHKMTLELTLLMPDDTSVVEARKQVTDFLNRANMATGVIDLAKFSGSRPFRSKRSGEASDSTGKEIRKNTRRLKLGYSEAPTSRPNALFGEMPIERFEG